MITLCLVPFFSYLIDVNSIVSADNQLLYADDVKLSYPITSISDYFLFQQLLYSLSQWCVAHMLSLRSDKCVVLSFSIVFLLLILIAL